MAEEIEFYKETEFKDTEIGKFPKDWEVVKLKDACKLIRGTEPGSKTYNVIGKGFRFIRVSDISKQVLDTVFVDEKSEKLVFCHKDDVLLALDGVPGVVAKGVEGAISSGIRIVKPNNNIYKEFLFYILQCSIVQKIINDNITGSTIKHAARAVNFIKLVVPPLEEQQKITEILSTVDEAIQKTDDIIANTERLKKGLMQELLTKGMGHKEFKDTEIGRIPKEWEAVELGKISNILMGQSPPGKTYNNDGKGIPFLQGKAEFGPFYPRHIKFTTSPLKIAESGSILISVRAPVGDVNIANINYCIGRGLASISVRKGSNIFLFYLLKYFKQIIEKEGTGSTFKAINKNRLENVKIPWPPLEEQPKIASILSTVDEKLENLKRERTKLERIKQWFMEELLSGRIRVRVA